VGTAVRYTVTYLPPERSVPEERDEDIVTGDPDTDVDRLIDEYSERGAEVIHVRWSNGSGTIYAAPGIDR
jgi:hypothetical protein